MKLLIVIDSLGRGGAEQALVNLLPALKEHGCDCEVAALWPPYDVAVELEESGIVVHRLNVSHRWNAVQAVRRLCRLARRLRSDVLHGHVFFASIYTALTRLFLPGVHRVVTFHGIDYDFQPAVKPWHRARKHLHGWLMRRGIDRYTAVSSVVAQHFEKHLSLSHITVIHNALAVQSLQPASHISRDEILRSYGIAPDKFVIAMPARLMPEKGHTYYLQALDLLRDRNMCPHTVMLGDGPCRAAIICEITERRLDSQVTLLSALPHAQAMAILGIADLYVLASTHEGLPLAIGEAMALERPVVVTDVGGVRDIVADRISGYIVPPCDPSGLADAISQLIHDADLRARLGLQGRLQVIEKFSVEKIAKEWERFYSGVLSR